MCRAIRFAVRHFSALDLQDYVGLLRLRDDYGVAVVLVAEDGWLASQRLRETRLAEEGVLILGIECPSGHFVATPSADTVIQPSDHLTVYDRSRRTAEIDQRAAGAQGDAARTAATAECDLLTRTEGERAGR